MGMISLFSFGRSSDCRPAALLGEAVGTDIGGEGSDFIPPMAEELTPSTEAAPPSDEVEGADGIAIAPTEVTPSTSEVGNATGTVTVQAQETPAP